MFTDPSFSTPQGGDLKGVNSPNPRPLPPQPSPPPAPGPSPTEPPTRTLDAGSLPLSPFPSPHRPLPVALAGFLPKTGPKPPQIQGNQAKPPAHHSTTTTPTTTARLARSPGAAPTRSPWRARPLAGPPTTAAAALAGKPSESALSWAILAGTLANAACTDSHTTRRPDSLPTPRNHKHPHRGKYPTTSSTRWKYGS